MIGIERADRIVLAVSGSIAAFKGAALASRLVQGGFDVRVILTRGGARFVTALTFEALTGHPVGTEVWDEQVGASRMGHLELARWADLLVVAPASAAVLARLALGMPVDLLGAVALATAAPLVLAPAMEPAMLRHPSTQQHLVTLRQRGAIIIGPVAGRLASGVEGCGRMSEPGDIISTVETLLAHQNDLVGRSVLVTAGPTFEPLDDVRFLGNRSSGKMGYAIADEARRRGANVTLVSGPTCMAPPGGVSLVPVETAEEMERAVMEHVAEADIIVMAAAVADFRPQRRFQGKLRRSEGLTLDLTATPDIAQAAVQANPRAYHVGFALEAGNLVRGAEDKRRRKQLDLVVGNLANSEHTPFGADTNRVIFVTADGVTELPEMGKTEVARRLFDVIIARLESARAEKSL